jgi:hypothetical protein
LTVMTGVTPLAISIGGVGAPLGYLGAGVVLAVFAVGFTAFTVDPLTADPDEFAESPVELTVVAGTVAHRG